MVKYKPGLDGKQFKIRMDRDGQILTRNLTSRMHSDSRGTVLDIYTG
jgi:hypothetical protein